MAQASPDVTISPDKNAAPIEYPKSSSCGLFNWRPSYLQRFSDTKYFMVNFSLLAVIQGAYFSYLIGCSSTLEKRFSYSSRLTGFILIADNFSQILLSPVVGFLGKRMNKAKLIASGMLFVSFSSWLTAVPYFIYGPATHFLTESVPASILGAAEYTTNRTIEMCGASKDLACDSTESTTVWPAFFIIWLASFLNGVGYTAFYTLGFPYVDDNIPKENAPIYFAIVAALRLLGPTSGFLMVSFCLSYYENPFMDVNLDTKDPRFVGAWWIGFLIIGGAIFVASLPLFLFPRNLKTARVTKERFKDDLKGRGAVARFKEMTISLRRILTNPLFMFDLCSSIVRTIGFAGFYITQPKYIEAHFRKSAGSASFATGVYNILSIACGIITGGVFIKFCKPGPRALTSLVFLLELFANVGLMSGLFFGCQQPTIFAVNTNLMDSCNTDCHCTRQVLQPYCSADGQTNYFSPCFAGCQTSPLFESNKTLDNCMCETTRGLTSVSSSLTPGYCPNDCGNNFTKYMAFLSVCKFISSTSWIASLILRVRSVEERDKSFAMGLSMMLSGLLAWIPYPLVFGAVADAACAIWDESCSGRGNCWLYDTEKFRIYLHTTALIFASIGSIFDIIVICFSSRMQNIYVDEEKQEEIAMDQTSKTEASASTDEPTSGYESSEVKE